ncbi:MAG: CDP-diacylglycerol--serine O-phosphatidyltransferase, partial [Acidimicrobiales bacterium]
HPGLQRNAHRIPSAFTIANLFFGFAAITQALHEEFGHAVVLVVVAGLFDLLDGRIARLTGTVSELGAELDSLADLVSFGVAPAVLAYQWGLAPHGQPFLAAFAFVLTAALRLARFNVHSHETDGSCFAGLPSPAAAGLVVSVVALHPASPVGGLAAFLVPAVLVVAATLMVSPIPYSSFKRVKLRLRPSHAVAVAVVALVVIALEPTATLLIVAWGYAAAGPVRALVRRS